MLCDHRVQSSTEGERRPVIHVLLVGSGKKRFSKCLIFRKAAFFLEH